MSPRSALVVSVAVLVSMVAGGCSSGPSSPDAAEAAAVVRQGLGADDRVEECLTDGFAASSDARSALGTGGGASPEEQTALGEVLGACLPPEELGTLVTAAVAGAVGGTTPEQEACVRATVVELPAEDRTTLLVGLVLSGDADLSQLDVDLGEITSGILTTCGVTLDPAPGPEGTVAGDSSGVSTP
ncbi:MAG: hypothetical protein MUE36_05335 [Acidimicrobiales bacterium]|jgi:hypothetical protein|nr:hypothetical protein [Acidimicrobiales bacterium]